MPPKQRTKKRTKKKTKKKTTAAESTSDWIKFVNKYAKEHQMSYGDAMKPAGVEWQLRKEGNSSTTASTKKQKTTTSKNRTKKAAKKGRGSSKKKRKSKEKKELGERCSGTTQCKSGSCRRRTLKDGTKSKVSSVCMTKQKNKRKKKRFEDHRFPIM